MKVKLLPLLLKSSVFLCLPSVVRGGSVTDRQRVETTYADLRPDDLVVDKTGKAWPIADLDTSSPHSDQFGVTFMLCDPVTKVGMHFVRKDRTDIVTVSRIPSHADEAAKLAADFDVNRNMYVGAVTDRTPDDDMTDAIDFGDIEMEEALANVATIVEPEPLVEYTATEYDAANTATDEQPVRLPAFESMTPLEQRSHLYLVHGPEQQHLFKMHGIYPWDLKSRDELISVHNDAHRLRDEGTLKSAYVPHVHEVSA